MDTNKKKRPRSAITTTRKEIEMEKETNLEKIFHLVFFFSNALSKQN